MVITRGITFIKKASADAHTTHLCYQQTTTINKYNVAKKSSESNQLLHSKMHSATASLEMTLFSVPKAKAKKK